MTFDVYIVVEPGADRPYVSTHRPTEERVAVLRSVGAEVYVTAVEIPEPGRPPLRFTDTRRSRKL